MITTNNVVFFFAFSVVFSSADIIKQPFLEVCIRVQQVLQNRCCGKRIPTTRHQPLSEISCIDSSPSPYYDSEHCLLLHFQPLLSSFSPQPKAKNLRKGQTLKSIEVSSSLLLWGYGRFGSCWNDTAVFGGNISANIQWCCCFVCFFKCFLCFLMRLCTLAHFELTWKKVHLWLLRQQHYRMVLKCITGLRFLKEGLRLYLKVWNEFADPKQQQQSGSLSLIKREKQIIYFGFIHFKPLKFCNYISRNYYNL